MTAVGNAGGRFRFTLKQLQGISGLAPGARDRFVGAPLRPMSTVLLYEIHLALRRLWRRPGQTGLLLGTFAVSIALTLLSWSLFYTIFLKSPEFDPRGELCVVNYLANTPGAKPDFIGRADIEAWQSGQKVFSAMTPVGLYRSVFIATATSSERYLGALLSSTALRMVGAKPLLGRLFTPDEDKYHCAPTLIFSEHTWRTHFGADPHIIGQVVTVNGYAATIVGVMPEDFRFPNSQDVWLPIGFDIWEWQDPTNNTFDVLARLKPGITLGRATRDLQLMLENRGPGTVAAQYHLHTIVKPFREYFLYSSMHQSALVLFALSLIFVLVSCANAANLVMIDFFGRSAELAALLALGVPRRAAMRNLIFQVALVAVAAAMVGVGVLLLAAPSVHEALVLMLAPYWLKFEFAAHHLAMAAVLAAVSTLAAVLVPLVYLSWVGPEQIIRDGAGTSRGTGRSLWRRTLLIGQVALLTVLGVAAGLLLQSNRHVGEDHWGYDASKIFLGKLDMPKIAFPKPEDRLTVYRKIIAEVRRLPGIRDAAITFNPPGYSQPPRTRYALNPATLSDGREDGRAIEAEVSDGVFSALGVPFVAGGTFPAVVDPAHASEVVINESLAARLWPGRDPLGQTLYARWPWMDKPDPTRRVIVRGVVRDFQASGPQSTNNDLIYMPFTTWTPSSLFFVAGGTSTLPLSKEISDAIWRVDPRVVPYFPDSIKHQIDMTLGYVRLTAKLTTIFALAAGLLCGVGVYSITVAQVLQRQREFGIRLALGIEPIRLWRRFALAHLITAGIGVALGLVAAAAVMHAMGAMLYGVNPTDPLTYVVVAVLILIISGLASVPSLFRLQRINPADCLRTL
ncbi:MAG: ABC transporter permease [Opitutales bacterium]